MVSGDGNDALVFIEGAQILRADVKSESNSCVVAIGGNASGGGRASIAIGGRADAGATQIGVFDVMGGVPDVKWLYGTPRSYTNMVVDSSSSTARTLALSVTGGGLLDYGPSGTTFTWSSFYRGQNMTLDGGNINLGNFAGGSTYNQGILTAFSGIATYRWALGTTPNNFITADGVNGQTNRFIWCWDTVAVGSAKCITLGDRSVQIGATGHSVGFLGVTPVTIRTGWTTDTGTSKRTANATYSGTAEAAYTQATIQTLMNGLRDATQTIKALKEDLLA